MKRTLAPAMAESTTPASWFPNFLGTPLPVVGPRIQKVNAKRGRKLTASVRAVDRQPAERGECAGAGADRRQRGVHRLAQLGQPPARGVDADQGGESGLVLRRVLAHGLAEGFALALDVEQVV